MQITKGSTYRDVLRWGTSVPVFKAITGITSDAPCVITATGHGVPDGWDVAISNVRSMARLNAKSAPPGDEDFHKASVLDANTIVLPYVNAVDYGTYSSGGVLMYYTPVDLTGYDARMTFRDSFGGTELLSLTVANGGIVIDTVAKTISRYISAVITAAITWESAVYDLEMVSVAGDVTKIDSGTVTVISEATT